MAQVPLPNDAAPLELLRETGAPDAPRLLTLVIASYNHHRYLTEAFSAIEASSVCDRIALLLIDDGSTDGTIGLMMTYPFDPALHVRVYSKGNAGLRDTLASGLALTATRFVAFIASDDRYEPAGLNAIIARLATRTADDICWICQATYLEGRDGEQVYGESLERLVTSPAKSRLRQLSIAYPKPLLLQSTVFACDLLRSAKPWQSGVRLDDWPTFIKVAERALVQPVDMAFLSHITLCRYRLHAAGVHNDVQRQLSMCMEVADKIIDHRYRNEAIARIHADIGLVHLFERRFIPALRHIGWSIVIKPSWGVLTLVPRRITLAIWSRIGRRARTLMRSSSV